MPSPIEQFKHTFMVLKVDVVAGYHSLYSITMIFHTTQFVKGPEFPESKLIINGDIPETVKHTH